MNFPVDVWARVAARRIRAAERLLLADGDARGYEPLRREIASRLGSARGITCSADQIVIFPASSRRSILSRACSLSRASPHGSKNQAIPPPGVYSKLRGREWLTFRSMLAESIPK